MRKFNIKVNGQPYEVEVEELLSGADAFVAPVPVPVSAPVSAPVTAAPSIAPQTKALASNAKGNPVSAPMPGTVLDFKVANGDTVKKGQPIIILEAMKMENEIAANNDGVITLIATKGSSVNTGDTLAVIA